ncbi:HEAT repeat domain-containing protein [Candidatus Parvarchaeota archaeon]|nr:HEAT repeat domain-containing protein [Candidatus Parvarchaeota archaeon]
MARLKGGKKQLPAQVSGAVAADISQTKLDVRGDDFSSYSTEKLISLSFDENPKIRIRVVYELSKRSNDPTAVFGLIELCADKNESVKQTAKLELAKIEGDSEASKLEQLFLQKKDEDPNPESVRKKLMPSIEKLFSQKGKSHMSGSIEKLFVDGKGTDSSSSAGKPQESLSGIPMISHSGQSQKPEPDEIETIGEGVLQTKPQPGMHGHEKQETKAHFAGQEVSEDEAHIEPLEADKAAAKAEDEKKLPQDSAKQVQATSGLEAPSQPDMKPGAIATTVLALAKKPGITEKDLKSEEKRLLQKINMEVRSAFAAAKQLLGANSPKRAGELKEGMEKIATEELDVSGIEKVEIKKGKKSTFVYRISLKDSTGQCIAYVQEAKGNGIEVGDRLKFSGCSFEKNQLTGEECLLLGPRSKLVIIR